MIKHKSIKEEIKQLAEKYFDEIVEYRRHFHKYPELSTFEENTSKFICSKLDEFGIEYQKDIGGFGICGFVNGKNPQSKCVALRADMDALPIKEETNLPFKSEKEGIMHACGHDVHMSSLLGTIKILKDLKDKFEGRVMFIFQPSEETYPGGALKMLRDGLFENVTPSSIFAFHATPEMDCGYIGMIVGKWQHILIVGYSFQGSDTLDMTKYPPNFNTFREDNTLLVTNGEQEVNVRYFVRDKKLFSFILGASDTSIMEIKKLTKDELILQVPINDGTQRKENLYYKRVD